MKLQARYIKAPWVIRLLLVGCGQVSETMDEPVELDIDTAEVSDPR